MVLQELPAQQVQQAFRVYKVTLVQLAHKVLQVLRECKGM